MIENVVAQSLMAVGLYSLALECTSLACCAAIELQLLQAPDKKEMKRLREASKTLDSSIKFCGPRLIKVGVLTSADVDCFHGIRKKRNNFIHAGYNHVFSLTLADVLPEVKELHRMARLVENWSRTQKSSMPSVGDIEFTVSPAFFGFIAMISQQLAETSLTTKGPAQEI